MEGLELKLSVRQGFPSAWWPSPLYRGQSLTPSCWSRSPGGRAHAGSVPFKCVFFPLPAWGPLPQRGGVLKQVGPVQALGSCRPQTEV